MQGLSIYEGKRKTTWKYKRELWRDKTLIKTVYMTLGTIDELSRAEAEHRASELNLMISRGVDPTATDKPNPKFMTVGRLIEFWLNDMADRELSPTWRADSKKRCEHFREFWNRPLHELEPSDVQDLHRRLKNRHGNRYANMTIGHLRAAWNVGHELLGNGVPPSPVRFRKAKEATKKDYSHRELETFWQSVAKAGPMRAAAWEFGLLSGLRPGNVVGLRRAWRRDDRVVIPRANMKTKDDGRPDFECPMSDRMQELVAKALPLGDLIRPGTDLVFPSGHGKEVNLRPYGNVLRHWHTTVAGDLGIDPITIEKLHDHSLKGLLQTYRQANVENFEVLARAQQQITDYFKACRP